MIRFLEIENFEKMQNELEKVNVSRQGILAMCKKSFGLPLKIDNISSGAANILKQEMLIVGGDAAISEGIVEGSLNSTDIVLLGTSYKIKKLIHRLRNYKIFNLDAIREDLKITLQNFEKSFTKKISVGENELILDSTKIMGILNTTPDSFSDGGKFNEVENAIQRAIEIENNGADFLDIGGESSRPGAESVSLEEEIKRVIPIVNKLKENINIPISVDTYKAKVAKKALENGAQIINDISALRFDKEMINVLKDHPKVPVILMHMQGEPKNMQKNPVYNDTVKEILEFFEERVEFCLKNNVSSERIIIDPGVGFGKRHQDNLLILQRLQEFHSLNLPILLGTSRKSFINRIYQSRPQERLSGTLATAGLAHKAKVQILRVHDVKEHARYLKVLDEIRNV